MKVASRIRILRSSTSSTFLLPADHRIASLVQFFAACTSRLDLCQGGEHRIQERSRGRHHLHVGGAANRGRAGDGACSALSQDARALTPTLRFFVRVEQLSGPFNITPNTTKGVSATVSCEQTFQSRSGPRTGQDRATPQTHDRQTHTHSDTRTQSKVITRKSSQSRITDTDESNHCLYSGLGPSTQPNE